MNRRGFFKLLATSPIALMLKPKEDVVIKKEARDKGWVHYSDKGNDRNGDGSWDKPYRTLSRVLIENPEMICYKFPTGMVSLNVCKKAKQTAE